MLVVSTGLTAATLSVVGYNVQNGIRQSLNEELRNSVKTYQTFAQQREAMMARSAELLADLPTVRALMTTEDLPTIQNESEEIWKLSGSDLLVFANRAGVTVGVQSRSHDFDRATAQQFLQASLDRAESRAWWSGNGRLYQVWLQPIFFGPASRNTTIGYLAIGHQVDSQAAREFGAVQQEVVGPLDCKARPRCRREVRDRVVDRKGRHQRELGPVLGRRGLGQQQACEQIAGLGGPGTATASTARALPPGRDPQRPALAGASERECFGIG